MVRFVHYLRVCHLEFDKEAISDGFMAHFCVFMGCVVSMVLMDLVFLALQSINNDNESKIVILYIYI